MATKKTVKKVAKKKAVSKKKENCKVISVDNIQDVATLACIGALHKDNFTLKNSNVKLFEFIKAKLNLSTEETVKELQAWSDAQKVQEEQEKQC